MRDYRIIGENIAQTGFFSEYLPPCFQLNIDVFKCPAPANCDVVAPYTFTMSRFNGNDARRIISLPEIGAYIALFAMSRHTKIIQRWDSLFLRNILKISKKN